MSDVTSLPLATKIRFQVGESEIFAYRLGEEIRFIHSQIANPIGRQKGSVQSFCAKHKEKFPPFIEALDPEKDHSIMLSSLKAALAYWKWQAKERKNPKAEKLIQLLEQKSLLERDPEIVNGNSNGNSSSPNETTLPLLELLNRKESSDSSELETNTLDILKQKLELITATLEEAGLDKNLIAQYKLNAISNYFPSLKEATESAKMWVSANDPNPKDLMNVTELAINISESLNKKIKPHEVNKALEILKFQLATNNGVAAYRLTKLGKQYGRALIVTGIGNNWSGPVIYWDESVVSTLVEYFRQISAS